MQRISKLKLKNFKFFYGEKEIDFERKNVLLYGENGSGKSAIYWALYTFFQSVYKPDIRAIRKYFDPQNIQNNLINFYCADKKDSLISVEYSDGYKSVEKRISLNKTTTRTSQLTSDFAKTSDFLNYKFLFQIYNFRNTEPIDLFPVFETDLLLFVTFRRNLARHDGRGGTANAAEWWEYLRAGIDIAFGARSTESKTYEDALTTFDSECRSYVENIVQSANEYLHGKFEENIKIVFDYHPARLLKANSRASGSVRFPDPPKIILRAEIVNGNLPNGKELTSRPQIFLNEAKLTAIALSIKLAAIDEKYINGFPRVLIIDDLLISLDMSNRDKVIDIIFSEFVETSQMIILTHDRSFFELVRREIAYRSSSAKWKLFEMFVDDKDGFDKPYITESKSLMAKARNYFDAKDYPACANHLRQAAEQILDRLVPSIYRRGPEGGEIRELGSLENKVGKLWKAWEHFTIRENLSSLCPLLQRLDKYKDTLLNALSHFNAYSQIYRQELKTTIDTLTRLEEIRNDIIVPVDSFIEIQLLTLKGDTYKYTGRLKDDVRRFKLGDDPSFYGLCKVELLSCIISSNPYAIHPISRTGPYKEISSFVDDLVAFTNTKVTAADPTDAVNRKTFETELTCEKVALREIPRY